MPLETDLDDIGKLMDRVEPDEVLELASALVAIPTVNTGAMPTGNETAACEFIATWLEDIGVPSQTLESAPGRGNLIARLPGSSGEPGLMFMSHTDVVPVEQESRWTSSPFKPVVRNGRLYGRGTADMKGQLACQLVALKLLKQSGIPLRHDLVLAAAADEEHGGRYGMGWLVDNHPEKVWSPFAVNEGGGTTVPAAGTTAYLLGVGEKGRLQLEIDVAGESAHASVPWQGENALVRAAQVVNRITAYEPERDTSVELFAHLSDLAIEHAPSPASVDAMLADMETDTPRLASVLRALSRMTITPTMVSGGIKSNSVPERVTITCDIRALPGQDLVYVENQVTEILSGMDGVSFTIDNMAVSNASPFETDFASRIRSATELALDRTDLRWAPLVSTGFTDSRFTRPQGTVTYGFVGMDPTDDPMLRMEHGTDESVAVASLTTGARVMAALAADMCG
jgi:acetylornithine deacetylase/succinyl-diaminopimelate desuccinylase-like protein